MILSGVGDANIAHKHALCKVGVRPEPVGSARLSWVGHLVLSVSVVRGERQARAGHGEENGEPKGRQAGMTDVRREPPSRAGVH